MTIFYRAYVCLDYEWLKFPDELKACVNVNFEFLYTQQAEVGNIAPTVLFKVKCAIKGWNVESTEAENRAAGPDQVKRILELGGCWLKVIHI